MGCYSLLEIPVVGPRGCTMRMDGWVTVDFSDANGFSGVSTGGGFVPEKAFFKSNLCLGSQVVMQTSQNDDDFVAGICCLANQPGVARRLT